MSTAELAVWLTDRMISPCLGIRRKKDMTCSVAVALGQVCANREERIALSCMVCVPDDRAECSDGQGQATMTGGHALSQAGNDCDAALMWRISLL